MSQRVWKTGLWVLLSGAFLLAAYLIINTTFMFYDDEGYVLLSYRNFNAGKHLYDEIFSQYGPWPYLYHLIIGLSLGEPLTHMIGRNLTALHWTCCALAAGAIAGRITSRTTPAIFASLATFGLLWQMSSEPSHPGSLIAAMLAITVLLSVISYQRHSWHWLGITTGIAAALLLLTKINVGLFLVAGAGFTALRFTQWRDRWHTPANIGAGAALLVLPWALMAKKLGEPWILIFAIQFTGATAGLLWITPPRIVSRLVMPRTWLIAAVAFVGTVSLVALTVCLRGTSPAALLQAVLIDPLRHPASFMIGLHWPSSVWAAAFLCWAITFRAGWELRKQGEISPLTQNVIVVFRLLVALAFIFHAESWLTLAGIKGLMILCLPLTPVFLVPLESRADSPSTLFESKTWVACLALPQVLHAYPVAGSQMGWGTFLLVPVMVSGLYEAIHCLRFKIPGLGRRLSRFIWSILVLTGAFQLGLLLNTGWTRYHTSKPLGLPGAEDIRPGDRANLMLRMMTLNASLHADVLFSRPGMFSYNIWSNVPTPTDKNATHWFWLLNPDDQQQIVDHLQHTPRSAVITSSGLDEFLASINVPMKGTLHDYILSSYRILFTVGELHFLVPSASSAVPFGQYELLVSGNAAQENQSTFLIRTNVVLTGRPAFAQLRPIASSSAGSETNLLEHPDIVLEPINTRGAALGPAVKLPLSQPVSGLFRVNIYLTKEPHLDHPVSLVLQIIDANGAVLSESIN